MLSTIDQALAGAIDFVADDLTNTVKSVREKGALRTLGNAVEDAASLVKGGASAVLGVGGKTPQNVSGHSGISGSYADLCAGRGGGAAFPYNGPGGAPAFQYTGPGGGAGGGYNGGAAFPYVPQQPAKRTAGAAKAPAAGGFGPGIGIQRGPPQGAAPAYAGAGAFSAANALAAVGGVGANGGIRGGAASAPAYSAASYPTAATTTSSQPSGPPPVKGPPMQQVEAIARFDRMKAAEPENLRCFDCGVANSEWASVSFGIFVCIECSGQHRQMGTHISRIRSIKMDSWTEAAMRVFDHGGNRRLAAFFAANGVDPGARYQRYTTAAGEWYREAWIKNRTLGRDVPAPPPGINVGPCTHAPSAPAAAAEAKKAAPAAPPADLLDLGGQAAAAPRKAPAPAPTSADLLGFGEESSTTKSTAASNSDLLGVATAAQANTNGSLLGLDSALAAGPTSLDPLGSALTAPSPAGAPQPAPAPAPVAAPALAPTAVAAPVSTAAPAPAGFGGGASIDTNTLAGGARLAEPEKKVDDDPFAMALSKWGM